MSSSASAGPIDVGIPSTSHLSDVIMEKVAVGLAVRSGDSDVGLGSSDSDRALNNEL